MHQDLRGEFCLRQYSNPLKYNIYRQFMNVGYLGVHKKRIIIENLPLPLFAKEG